MSPKEIKQELVHASFQELVDELFSRCEHCVLVAEREEPRADATDIDTGPGVWFRKGSWFATLGMLNSVQNFLVVDMLQARREGE